MKIAVAQQRDGHAGPQQPEVPVPERFEDDGEPSARTAPHPPSGRMSSPSFSVSEHGMGCLTCPAADRLRQMAAPGPPEGGVLGGPSARVRGAGARGSPGLTGVPRCRGGSRSPLPGPRPRPERRASPARIRGSHDVHGRLVRLDSPRRAARSRAGRARGRTGRRSVRGAPCHRGMERLDRFVQAPESIEAPSTELEASRASASISTGSAATSRYRRSASSLLPVRWRRSASAVRGHGAVASSAIAVS